MLRRLLPLFALLLAASPARAEWYRAESPNFVVYGEMAQGGLRERVQLLEQFDAFLRLLTGTTAPPSPNKFQVYLVHGLGELQIVIPGVTAVSGVYRATPEAIIAVADENSNGGANEDDTLLHEYAHHFMSQYHPAPYPSWYVEGFAEYVATADIAPRRIYYGNYNANRASWLNGDSDWVPYENILYGRLRRVSGSEYYAQSWLLTHYVMAEPGRRAAMGRYVQALARGDDPRTAFPAAFGMTPAELDRTMRNYVRRITFHRIERDAPPPPAPVTMVRLASQGLNPPLIEAALLMGVPQRVRETLLARARRLGDDDYGRRVQARAEIVYGELASADRLLDPMLAAAPGDTGLLYLKGLRHLVAARREPLARGAQYRLAGRHFARVINADPNHWQALFRYAETLPAERLLTDNGQNILLLAVSLAPQVDEIRMAAAHLLLLRGRFAEAEGLLLPLSDTVHDPARSTRAAEFLRLARARQRPEDEVIFKIGGEPADAGARRLAPGRASRRFATGG
jgi:hypothetical protein